MLRCNQSASLPLPTLARVEKVGFQARPLRHLSLKDVGETAVIAGHGLVTAARKLGLAHLPQIEVPHVTNVTDADLRRW